jgi:hypothetical protein
VEFLPEKDSDPRDKDPREPPEEAPEIPPDEPRRPDIEEPPSEPKPKGPYVVGQRSAAVGRHEKRRTEP